MQNQQLNHGEKMTTESDDVTNWEIGKTYLIKGKNTTWSSIHEVTPLKFSKNKKAILLKNSFQPSLGNMRQDILNWYDISDLFQKYEIFDDMPEV